MTGPAPGPDDGDSRSVAVVDAPTAAPGARPAIAVPLLDEPEAFPGPAPKRRRDRWASAGREAWARAYRQSQKATEKAGAWRYLDLALVIVLMGVAVGLRWRDLWTNYWGDEAIAIGIASHAIHTLPHYLVNDGSPPLYYVMLHYWMRLFGQSEVATHTLSLIPAILAVPATWWSGTRLFGPWAGRAAAALVATCAYLDYYATETRMYSWLVLMATLALSCFVLAYRGAGRRYWVAAAFAMTCVLYLQYYGLYLLAAIVACGAVAAARARHWARLKATLLFGLACAAAFAPWVPQFVYQAVHTGAPWAPHPSVLDFFGDSFNSFASAGWAGVVLAIFVALVPARWDWLPWRWRRSVPAAAPVLALCTAVPIVLLLMAWVGGQVVNSWNPRYLGIALVPATLAIAGGLSRARGRLGALVIAVLALTATAVPMLVDRGLTVQTSKSDVAYLLDELKPQLQPGALVISAEVTDTPVVALDLGKGYRYANPFGRLADPLVVDWSNLPTRLQRVNAATDLAPLLDSVPVGGQVLLVNPTSWGGPETPERYAGPVEAEGVAANQVVIDDPDLLSEETLQIPAYSNPLYPMTVVLFQKVRANGQP
ncbi:MAG TPA: glycosyltransferase family 39 protein [Acidimicrobiales bacterium]|nr:glycosyltransferase family 39 protein [Acidimicrobiales bacterium]